MASPKPTNPKLWSRAKAEAKKKFKVYPSAYANAWASKWYKEKGGGWRGKDNSEENIMPYEKYTPKQKRLAAVAVPRKKITSADLKKLRQKKKK